MIRMRALFGLGLLAAFALAAGCGKKPDTTPAGPDPGPPGPTGGDPLADDGKATKADAVKRLKDIGLAIHNYESATQSLPAGIVGPKGELGLSWRVQILPYLGKDEAELYKQFNLKESWDSEQNKKLIAKMPKSFASPGKDAEGKTHLRSFAGESAFLRIQPNFGPKGKAPPPPFANLQPGAFAPGQRFSGISDGTSNTLIVAEAPEAVEWTKPDDLPYRGFSTPDRPIPAPKLGGVFPGGFHGLMCDGAVHFFPATLDEKIISAMISVHGGEVLPKEATDILFPPKPKKPGPPTAVPDSLPAAAARKTAVANYQKILRGMHDYHDVYGYLPAGVVGPNKGVGLSWRVQILPYIGEEKLYKEFKLAEPWDSEHNKALLEKMPAVFASPGKPVAKSHTFVRTTQGPGGIIRTRLANKGEQIVDFRPDSQPGTPVQSRPLTAIVDGLSITILFAEAGDAVPWTKPDEIFLPQLGDPFSGKGGPPQTAKLPALGGVFADGFHAVMADGRVTFYKSDYPAVELAKLFCPADGWVVEALGEPEKIGYSIAGPKPAGGPPKGGVKEPTKTIIKEPGKGDFIK